MSQQKKLAGSVLLATTVPLFVTTPRLVKNKAVGFPLLSGLFYFNLYYKLNYFIAHKVKPFSFKTTRRLKRNKAFVKPLLTGSGTSVILKVK